MVLALVLLPRSPRCSAVAAMRRLRTRWLPIPEAFEAGQVVEQPRASNPASRIIARAHSDEEVAYLAKLGADRVIMGEREIARGMIEDFAERQAQRTSP